MAPPARRERALVSALVNPTSGMEAQTMVQFLVVIL